MSGVVLEWECPQRDLTPRFDLCREGKKICTPNMYRARQGLQTKTEESTDHGHGSCTHTPSNTIASLATDNRYVSRLV